MRSAPSPVVVVLLADLTTPRRGEFGLRAGQVAGTDRAGLPSLPHSNFGGKHGTFRGDAICWACDSSGLGGRLYPFSGEQVRVREADREITRLCAWGDEVHRKDRPEREEARGLENENSMRVVDQTGILESPRRKGVQRANEGSPARWTLTP